MVIDQTDNPASHWTFQLMSHKGLLKTVDHGDLRGFMSNHLYFFTSYNAEGVCVCI